MAAPVLGRPDLAASGQLGIVAAGPEEALQRCEPLLAVIGKRTFVAGTVPEAATAIKLANNLVLGCAMVAMAEGFSLVRKYGVEPRVLYDVMTEGLFSAPAYKVLRKDDGRRDVRAAGLTDYRGAEGREPDSGRRRSRACRCQASTSIAIACSAPWRTATATRIRRRWRWSRRGRADWNKAKFTNLRIYGFTNCCSRFRLINWEH